LGATGGSIGAGFVLLPALGMERSLFLLAAVYALTALLVPKVADAQDSQRMRDRIATLAVAAACLALFPFGLMARSYFRIIEHRLPGEKLVATREGLTETIRYYRNDQLGMPLSYRLVTNGHSMSATNLTSKRYMKLYVYFAARAAQRGARRAADQLRCRLDRESVDRFGGTAPHRRRGHLARDSRDELHHLP
jgi:predicted membrane-bound spermidine synthase